MNFRDRVTKAFAAQWRGCILGLLGVVCGSTQAIAQVTVTATQGTGSAVYTTVRAAFTAINGGTHRGVITVDLSSNTTESAPATLNSSGTGSANYTSVVLRPVVDGVVVSGNPGTGSGVIQLNGADNVTIDGDNPNTPGTQRNLAIAHTGSGLYNSVVRVAAGTNATSASNNSIKNCIILGSVVGGNSSTINDVNTLAAANSYGVYVGGNGGSSITPINSFNVAIPAGASVDNFHAENNEIDQCGEGIVFNGGGAGTSTGLVVRNNLIGAPGAPSPAIPPFTSPSTTVYRVGIKVRGTNDVTISGNTVRNIISFLRASDFAGIDVSTGGAVSISDNVVSTVAPNNTEFIIARGISLGGDATTIYTIRSNEVSKIETLGTGGSGQAAGISCGGSIHGLIELNRVHTIRSHNASSGSVIGIDLMSGSDVIVRNNMIWDLSKRLEPLGAGNFTSQVVGLRVIGPTNTRVVHNSVNLYGELAEPLGHGIITGALQITYGEGQDLDIRNNIFANTLTGGVGSTHVSIILPNYASQSFNIGLNNNAYFCGPDTASQGIGDIEAQGPQLFYASGFDPNSSTTGPNMRGYTNQLGGNGHNDDASIAKSFPAPFAAPTDLHIVPGKATRLESGGADGVDVLTDIDGDTRPGPAGSLFGGGIRNDIGADEFDGKPGDALLVTTTSLSTEPDVVFVGHSVDLVASVVPSSATGDVTFSEGAAVLGTAPIVGGIATLPTTFGDPGVHRIGASYEGDDMHEESVSAPLGVVAYPTPGIVLRSSPNPATCGTSVDLRATLSDDAATGTVEFFKDSQSLGSAPVADGSAVLSFAGLPPGSNTLFATYSGSGPNLSSPAYTQNITAGPTSIALSANPSPSYIHDQAQFAATVTPSDATGSVTFYDGAVAMGTSPLNSGVAVWSQTFDATGTHSVSATYSGDLCHPSRTAALTHEVQLHPTSTSLSTPADTVPCGAKSNLSAHVIPSGASGMVEFRDGAQVLGTASLAGGVATISVTLQDPRTHELSAVYAGDANHGGSQSGNNLLVVEAIATATNLTTDVASSPVGQKVNLTATVTPNDVAGDVDFTDGTSYLGFGPVENGTATLSVVFTTPGTHVLRATFTGDECTEGSTSPPLVHMVDSPTGILLSLFEAVTVNEGVELRWQFSGASELASAWLERAASLTGPWTRIDLATEVHDGITVGVDRSVEANRTYNYRLVASLAGGGTQTFSPIEGRSGALVTEFALTRLAPNPAHDAATIEYTLPREAKVDVSIVDLQGRVVASLVSGVQPAGRYQTVWTGQGRSGRMPSGLYFVRYRTPGKVTTKRLVLQ